ncbi:hypothetical protein WR25_02656 [Diploscapter pachys]|uniref:RRM domain-containing protein n=1 Tax=Diploscapter pachys TaxID=2018661 RepID=A0A2A2LJE7_9BILA|nr:hypothetical protein WR25_02656 [Diploscapter pachys]
MTDTDRGQTYAMFVNQTQGNRELGYKSATKRREREVSFARPSSDTIRGSNLYVSGIPKSMTLNELEGIFRPYGQIITSRILSDPVTGLSKGVGFVRFDKKNEAEIAIEQLNGTIPSSCTEQITVKFANNPATNTAKNVLQELEAVQQVAAAQSLIPFTLLAGAPAAAAPIRTTIGPIHHAPLTAKYRYSPLTGITAMPGMATAAIASQPTAADYFTSNALLMSQLGALSDVSAAGFSLAPTSLTAAYTTPIATTSPDAQGFTVMVSNLAPEADDTLLWQLFAPFGSVISIKIARDISNKCKGYAFISYASYAEALTAINALNGTQLGCRALQVTLKTAAAAPQLGAAIIR